MTLKYETELIKEIVVLKGHHTPLIHDESECIEKWIDEVKGAYPKLNDYQSEWLNYIVESPLGEFPYVSLTDVTTATVDNVVPYAYKTAILKGSTKYHDIDTGEFLETFEEGRNLELVSVKMPVLKTLNNQSNLFFTQTLTNFLSWRCISFDTFIKAEIYVKADGTVSDTLRLIVVQNINGAKKENVYTNDSIKKGVNVEVENVQFIGFHDRPNGIEEKGNGNLLELIESGKLEIIVSDKTNILTVNEDVELRGIGDVKDTLDLLTGEVTQRIGEITFDGSENWIASTNQGRIAYILPHKGVAKVFKSPISDKWICEGNANATSDTFFYIGGSYFNYITNQEVSLADFKAQLSDNPVSVQYFLATESVKTVDLNVVDQNNNKIDKIHVFNETTHVNASSDELTPTVNIGKSVSYPTIIKPSTKYTVDLKRNDKPLTVNLGGTEVAFASGETRKTIITPSTLTNDKLSYYGIGAKCNEIMLIEGEIERNIDYFTGMQSVIMQNQMPILSTVGKNLFDKTKIVCDKLIDWNTGNIYDDSLTNISDFIKVIPNTQYTMSFNFETSAWTRAFGFTEPKHDKYATDVNGASDKCYFDSASKTITFTTSPTTKSSLWTT